MWCCFSSSHACLVTTKMSTTERDSGDWSAEVKQEILSVVKQEPEDVCCTDCYMYKRMNVGEFWYWSKLLHCFSATPQLGMQQIQLYQILSDLDLWSQTWPETFYFTSLCSRHYLCFTPVKGSSSEGSYHYRHEKNSPFCQGFFWSKSNFLKIIYARENIPVARYQYSLGIYRRIYPATGVRSIPAAQDISGTWRLSG